MGISQKNPSAALDDEMQILFRVSSKAQTFFLRVAFDVPTQLEQVVNPCLSNVCKMRPFLG